MIVIGGYNSSNTCNLAHICAGDASHVPRRRSRMPALPHGDPPPRRRRKNRDRHRRLAAHDRTVRVGLTSGASTPDNLVERVIEMLDAFCNANAGGVTTATRWDPSSSRRSAPYG